MCQMMKFYLSSALFILINMGGHSLSYASTDGAKIESKNGSFVFRATIPQLCGMKVISRNGGIKIYGQETSQVPKGTVIFFNNSKDNIVTISPELSVMGMKLDSVRKGYIVFLIKGVEHKFRLDGSEVDLSLPDDKSMNFFLDFSEVDLAEVSSGDLDISLNITVSCK